MLELGLAEAFGAEVNDPQGAVGAKADRVGVNPMGGSVGERFGLIPALVGKRFELATDPLGELGQVLTFLPRDDHECALAVRGDGDAICLGGHGQRKSDVQRWGGRACSLGLQGCAGGERGEDEGQAAVHEELRCSLYTPSERLRGAPRHVLAVKHLKRALSHAPGRAFIGKPNGMLPLSTR